MTTEPPYSEEDQTKAALLGLDLDNWNDYQTYFKLGEELVEKEDFEREMYKIQDALYWSKEHFMRNSEANAAEHCNMTVYYSPIVSKIDLAEKALNHIRADRT